VTSSGTPLVLALEVRSWGYLIDEEHEESPEAPRSNVEEDDEEIGDDGLARKLKMGTQEAHKAAETVNFIREFIKGKVPREVYGQMVVNLFYVYQAMEEALDACADHEFIDPIHFPDELRRAATLEEDAEFFCGPDWRETMRPSPVTLDYVARLRHIAVESPELIVPHAYTRYLGDLSGGQLLRRAAIRGMKLPDDGSGVQFYVFRRIGDIKRFKDMYRARLDALEAKPSVADRMVSEANLAFSLNTRMFQELDVLMGFEVSEVPIAPAEYVPEMDSKGGLPAPPGDAAACPFAALAASGLPMPADHPAVSDPKPQANEEPSSRRRTSGTAMNKVLMAHAAVGISVVAAAVLWAARLG